MSDPSICPATRLLNLLSRRHMLVVLHTLSSGARGFSDLQDSLKINTATLTNRLRELETEGVIKKTACTKDSRAHYYDLTPRGKKMSKLIGQFAKL